MPTTTPRARRARRIGALLAAAVVATGCASAGDEAAEAPAPAADTVDAGGDGGEGAETESGAGDDAPQALGVGAPLGHKVVFRAHLSLQAEDPQAAITDIRRAVERVDGFVATADVRRGDDDQLRGTLTLRVPSGQLDPTLDVLRGIGDRVVDDRIDSDDVTDEFADVEAQLRNLRALEVELLSLLAEIREKSDNAEQILAVFERIRQVRGEIEQLEGRRQVLDDLVSLATVEVSIEPTPSAAPLASDEWRPGEVVRSAVRTTVAALRTIVDVAIWLTLTVIPVALVVLGVPFVVALALRRLWRRRPDGWTRPADGGGDRPAG